MLNRIAIKHSDSFIRTIPSVSEFHRFNRIFSAFLKTGKYGLADFTAGGEFHSAPKQITLTLYTDAFFLSIVLNNFFYQ